MNEPSEVSLKAWLDTLSEHLAVDYRIDEESMHILLDLARDAAHHVTRPAAPLSTFLIGVSVGQGTTLGAAAAKATKLVQTIGSAEGPPDRQ